MTGLRPRLLQVQPDDFDEPLLSDACVDKIFRLMEWGNYLQILFSFKIDTIRELHSYFLEEEEYKECQKIKTMLENHARATGQKYEL